MQIKKKIDFKFIAIIIVSVFIVVGGLYQLFIYSLLTSHFLKKESKYGITTNLGYRYHGKYHYTRSYYFQVNGKNYDGECDDRHLKLKHYFIEYYPSAPYFNRMTYIEATKADYDSLPVNGYKELPHN